MSDDFYCDEVLSARTPVHRVFETENVLAFHHTKPFYTVHIVVIPKRHIGSLLALEREDHDLIVEIIMVVKQIAAQIVAEHGGCRVITNLGKYQDSKHMHWHVVSGVTLRST